MEFDNLEFGERLVPNISPYGVSQEHIARYVFAENYTENKIVLDIACGCGYGSDYIAQTAKSVIGVDISSDAIDYAKENYQRDNLIFKEGDAEKISFPDNTFDVIVSFETIEHIKNYDKFLAECYRVLKAGGTFIVSTPNKNHSDGSNQFHIKEFTPEEFKKVLHDRFTCVKILGQTKINPIGLKIRSRIGSVIRAVPGGNCLLNSIYPKNPPCNLIFDSGLDNLLVDEYVVSGFKDSIFSSSVFMIGVCKK